MSDDDKQLLRIEHLRNQSWAMLMDLLPVIMVAKDKLRDGVELSGDEAKVVRIVLHTVAGDLFLRRGEAKNLEG